MSKDWIVAGMSLALVAIAVLAAWPSFHASAASRAPRLSARAHALTSGIFLGAGLIHMLPEAAAGFAAQARGYPWAFAIAGATALTLDILDRASTEADGTAAAPPLAAALALVTHSLFAGAALGATPDMAAAITLFVALVAHKGAASFAFSHMLVQSRLARRWSLTIFGLFVLALPAGVAAGDAAAQARAQWPLLLPAILALGAGTFLHFGTGHHPAAARSESPGPWAAWPGFLLMAAIAAIG